MELIANIFILITSVILIIWMIKVIKQTNSIFEKVVYILYMFAVFTPLIIFFLDVYNIPTKFKYIQNLNTDRWFSFISDYVINIIGTFISGFILVWITYKQIKSQSETNKEDKRIQNAPIFDYIFRNQAPSGIKYNHKVEVKEQGELYHLYFCIENIGLNHARNINFFIKVNGKNDRKMPLNTRQSFIKIGEAIWIDLIFELDGSNTEDRNITIEISYEDLLENKYTQKVKTTLVPVNLPVMRRIDIKNYNVDNFKYIRGKE